MPARGTTVPASASERERTAEHWSTHHEGTADYSGEVYWLAVPEVMRRVQHRSTGGRSEHWVNYFVLEFLGDRCPVARMASLGCGTGQLERHLTLLNAFQRCDAYDIASGVLEVARREAEAAGLKGVSYELGDIETLRLPPEAYEAVWFNGSLHHVRNLEEVCDGVAAALKPDGFLFLNEYVGANRFDLPPRQKEAIQAAFDLLPVRYRRSFLEGRPEVESCALIPDPRDVEAKDPSEAVRSADILEVVGRRFEVVALHKAGGTLLQFLLQGIAGHFRPEDPAAMAVLDMLFHVEDVLVDSGDLGSDFVTLAARRRGAP